MEFSDLALAKFLQTASELSPFILNFSLMDDESGTEGSQVGVFILNTPSGIAYVPVIGKGETTFPIDSIFLEEEKRFVPLTKATISRLINSPSMAMGTVKKIPESVVRNPDMSHLINPPRTGKYVYASASRLTEFMASLPTEVKEFAFEKIAAEHSIFKVLDKMFGLKGIFEALKTPDGGLNSGTSGPNPIRQSQPSVVTSAAEVRALADEALAAEFLVNGYAVTGNPEFSRVAVAYAPYNQMGQFQTVTPGVDSSDGARDYTIVMKDGRTMQAFLPKYNRLYGVNNKKQAAILENGDFAFGPMIAVGDGDSAPTVLKALFESRPPKLLRDCFREDIVMLFDANGDAIGPFRINSLLLTSNGAEADVSSLSYGDSIHKICAYNNVRTDVSKLGDILYVRHNVIVVSLGKDQSYNLEANINSAATRRELMVTQMLGAEMDLRHDGVEYTANGLVLGDFPAAMKVLVERESLDPVAASQFLKQASELHHVRIYMSKKASESPTPTDIPRYGESVDNDGSVGMGGAFMPALQQAAGLGDGQVMEATIISQLLQTPNLLEMVGEYLPDLQTATDKLGRVLFLSRVKMDQLSESLDSDSVFALINQIKTVYRTLGDATTKLEETFNASSDFEPNDGNPANTGV